MVEGGLGMADDDEFSKFFRNHALTVFTTAKKTTRTPMTWTTSRFVVFISHFIFII